MTREVSQGGKPGDNLTSKGVGTRGLSQTAPCTGIKLLELLMVSVSLGTCRLMWDRRCGFIKPSFPQCILIKWEDWPWGEGSEQRNHCNFPSMWVIPQEI